MCTIGHRREIGWWLGTIKRPNGDKSKLVTVRLIDGVRQPANFIILYTDESEGLHCLMYGDSVRESTRERLSNGSILERLAKPEVEGSEVEGHVEDEAEGVPSDAQASASPAPSQPTIDSGNSESLIVSFEQSVRAAGAGCGAEPGAVVTT